MWGAYAATFAVGFALSLVLSPVCARVGERLGIVDWPGGRRQHSRPTSRLGGVALYVAFVATVALSQALPVPRLDPNEPRRVLALLAGTSIVFLVGLLDDVLDLPAWAQFLGQLLAAAVGVWGLIFIEYVNNPFSEDPQARIYFPRWFAVGLSLFWLLGVTTTVNWLDGLDGLAAGVVAIASLVLFANAAFRLQPPQASVALLPLALSGACLGFLPHNFHPARVFMGGGAYTIGYALGALSIIGGAKVATVLLVIGVPALDVAYLILRRMRRGGRPHVGGRDHLHFRLLDRGWPQRRIVLGYYAFCAFFGALALALPPRQYKLLALLALGALSLAVLLRAERLPRRQA